MWRLYIYWSDLVGRALYLQQSPATWTETSSVTMELIFQDASTSLRTFLEKSWGRVGAQLPLHFWAWTWNLATSGPLSDRGNPPLLPQRHRAISRNPLGAKVPGKQVGFHGFRLVYQLLFHLLPWFGFSPLGPSLCTTPLCPCKPIAFQKGKGQTANEEDSVPGK